MNYLPESRYLTRFNRLKEGTLPLTFTPIGDVLLCEKIKEDELKVGSLVIPSVHDRQHQTMFAQKPSMHRVILTGSGYKDGEKDVPLFIKPGDIIIVGPLAPRSLSVFGGLSYYLPWELSFIQESEVNWVWHGDEAFNSFFETLNKDISGYNDKG